MSDEALIRVSIGAVSGFPAWPLSWPEFPGGFCLPEDWHWIPSDWGTGSSIQHTAFCGGADLHLMGRHDSGPFWAAYIRGPLWTADEFCPWGIGSSTPPVSVTYRTGTSGSATTVRPEWSVPPGGDTSLGTWASLQRSIALNSSGEVVFEVGGVEVWRFALPAGCPTHAIAEVWAHGGVPVSYQYSLAYLLGHPSGSFNSFIMDGRTFAQEWRIDGRLMRSATLVEPSLMVPIESLQGSMYWKFCRNSGSLVPGRTTNLTCAMSMTGAGFVNTKLVQYVQEGLDPGYHYRVGGREIVMGNRLVQLRCGLEALPRGGTLWTRTAQDAAWQAASAADETALLARSERHDELGLVQASPSQSDTLGATWSSGLPELPAGVSAWATDGVRDGLTLPPDGLALAAGRNGTELFVIDPTGNRVTVAEVDDAAAGPWLDFLDGAWYLGCFSDGWYLEWRSPDGVDWTQTDSAPMPDCGLAGAVYWRGVCGLQAVCGWSELLSQVVCFHRAGPDTDWLGPTQIGAAEDAVAPYLVELETGRWEAGWLLNGTWIQYRADSPAGPWSAR